ncbi:hypothetical protein NC653_027687 [Populus alba x Populus x berolinensis]|uniref:Uncharacterized protein n=1 Tax=Populus alba x Populus x berolinensis TaxID=444605 RepID=A0AAD6Q5G0_9ROSI|nr:hypothetical protein NC653_027687 [Populus alba x Populus x berolinensis]
MCEFHSLAVFNLQSMLGMTSVNNFFVSAHYFIYYWVSYLCIPEVLLTLDFCLNS